MIEKIKYVKIIFQNGSLIFRYVVDYHFVDKTQVYEITLDRGQKIILDLIYIQSFMGRVKKVKSNLE